MIRPLWVCSMVLSIVFLGEAWSLAADEAKAPATVTAVPRAEGKWEKRQAELNERVKNRENVRILFIGDSITQGWEKNGKDVWEKYYGNRNAVNLGIGGDRTQHVLWRLDHGNADGISPKLAVLMIGTNNIAKDSPEDIAAGVLAIQAKLKEKLPETQLLVLGVFPRGANDQDPKRQAAAKINDILKEKVVGDGAHYLDIGKEFLEPDGTLSKEIMPDLLHLSPKGYEIWAKAIEQTLADITEPVDRDLKK